MSSSRIRLIALPTDENVLLNQTRCEGEYKSALLRGGAPLQEAVAVTRADEDLAGTGKLQHDAFAAGHAVDDIAQETTDAATAGAAASRYGDFIVQGVIPANYVGIVDDHVLALFHVGLEHRAESGNHDLAAARGFHHKETTGLGKQGIADA